MIIMFYADHRQQGGYKGLMGVEDQSFPSY